MANVRRTFSSKSLVLPGRLSAGLVWFLFALTLSACGRFVSEAVAEPVEVVFDTPMAEIDRGVRLALRVNDWDGYGEAVDVRGDVSVIGASEWNYAIDGRGSIYVYRFSDGKWQEEAQLTASDRDTVQTENVRPHTRRRLRSFGFLVALDGDTLAVAGDSKSNFIYVFQRGENGWREQARVQIPGPPEGDLLLASLALFGDSLALSTFYMPPESIRYPILLGNANVHLFERVGDAWEESFQIAPWGEAKVAFIPSEVVLGASVALAGAAGEANVLAVGLPGFPRLPGLLESGPESGAVYIFERRDDGGWSQQATLRPASGEKPPGPGFMFSDNQITMFGKQATYIFPGHLYSEDPEITFFGAMVDLEENMLAVTAGYANTAHVFVRRGEDWLYRFRIALGERGAGSREDYGQPVAISGRTLLLGTPGEFGNSAYVFSLSPVTNDH